MKSLKSIILFVILSIIFIFCFWILKNSMNTVVIQGEVGSMMETPEQWKTIVGKVDISTVYSVKVGNNQEVPVPYGFYYVGGTLDSGVVISDDEQDKNKYVGQSNVPSGFDLDESNNPMNTIHGNQFVWIPCTLDDYHKTDFGTSYQNANWDTNIFTAEKTQIQKYGGFYVGRFEAGLADNISEFTTTQQHTGSNQVYNKEGIPQTKPGKVAWNFVDWNYAKTNSENMYNTNCVNSGLITGTQWDVMLQKIASSDSTKSLTSSNWGNYYNQELSYRGRSGKYTLVEIGTMKN